MGATGRRIRRRCSVEPCIHCAVRRPDCPAAAWCHNKAPNQPWHARCTSQTRHLPPPPATSRHLLQPWTTLSPLPRRPEGQPACVSWGGARACKPSSGRLQPRHTLSLCARVWVCCVVVFIVKETSKGDGPAAPLACLAAPDPPYACCNACGSGSVASTTSTAAIASCFSTVQRAASRRGPPACGPGTSTSE